MSKPLKEITKKIASGATPRGGKESYKDFGISLIRSQNILDFDFDYNGLAFIDKDQAQKLKNVIVEKNDILLNITGDSVARCSIVPEQVLPARVNQHVMIIRVDDKQANYKYVFYYLQYIKRYLLQLASGGATRNALTKTMIENLEYNHRSIEEQEAIANILSSLDDKIENNNAIIANLEEQAQAIFKSWFINFEPFQDEEFVDSELGRIPRNWRIATLKEFFPVVTGKKNANIATENGKYPFFTCAQDISYTDDFSFDDHAILVAGNGDFNVKRFKGKFEAYQRTYVLIPSDENLTGLLYHLINHYLKNIVSGYKGSVINYITKGMIEDFKFPFPNKIEEVGIVDVFNTIEKKIAYTKRENIKLEEIRDTLLPKLMSGEIRVEEATEVN